MDDNESKTTKYLVPANVSVKFEFFEGFGWRELFAVIVAAAFGFLIYLALGIPKSTSYLEHDELTTIQRTSMQEIEYTDDGKVMVTTDKIPSVLRMAVVFFFSGVAFFSVRKDPMTGFSLLFMLHAHRKFNNSQRLYLYKYNSGGM